jgi:hypothetical protein
LTLGFLFGTESRETLCHAENTCLGSGPGDDPRRTLPGGQIMVVVDPLTARRYLGRYLSHQRLCRSGPVENDHSIE